MQRNRCRWLWSCAACAALLAIPMSASGQDKVAVVGLSHNGEVASFDLVAGLESRLESMGHEVMTSESAINRLSYAQIAYDETLVNGMIKALNASVDAFFNQDPGFEEQLHQAITEASSRPLLLTMSPALTEALLGAALIEARAALNTAKFDEAANMVKGLVDKYPVFVPSRHQHPPAVIELVESARGQLASLGGHLLVELEGNSSGCALNLNGQQVLLDAARDIPVANLDYGTMLQCGGSSAGPFLLTINELNEKLPVGIEMIEGLAPLEKGNAPSLPESDALKPRFGELLRTLVGVDRLYLIAPGGEGVWGARIDAGGVRLATASLEVESVSLEMLRVLDSGKPTVDVAVDLGQGQGWERQEPPSYVTEYVLIGTGGAVLLGGAALLAVGAASNGDIDACVGREPACTESELEDAASGVTDLMFTSHILMMAGGAVAATGLTLLLVRMFGDDTEDTSSAMGEFGVGIAPGGATATWRWSW